MRHITADWVLPIVGPPIRRGTIGIDHGRIVDVGRDAVPGSVDIGPVAVLPGLVNTHTHLELSYLAGQIPAASNFLEWVGPVLARRRQGAPDPGLAQASVREGIAQARAAGTALVGDVSNTLATVAVLREGPLAAHVFYELIGFGPDDVAAKVASARRAVDALDNDSSGIERGEVRVSLAPHAPYSVSPALFRALRADLDANEVGPSTVHLGESPEEVELLAHGTGPWRGLLEALGAWDDTWRPTGLSPVSYLASVGFLDARVVMVHGVQLEGDDLRQLANAGATLVTCPRSNAHVGVGAPPIEAFYAMGVDVAFGTDSLASVATLSVFDEMAEARRLAPRVPARRLLESATLVGARALRREADYGSIEAGKRDALIAVRVPGDVDDVEEYLVSGVPSGAVTWIDHADA